MNIEPAFVVEFESSGDHNNITVNKNGVRLTLNWHRNYTPSKLKNLSLKGDTNNLANAVVEVCMDRLMNIDTVYTPTDKLFHLITSEPKWYAGKISKQHASKLIKSHKAGTVRMETYEFLFAKFGYKREEIVWTHNN